MATELKTATSIEHQGETLSNDIRRTIASVEPQCLRTFTPSLAVLARSAGSYHYTPEGRKLADFTSGVLVANLGHNPTRWWQRVLEYMSLDQLGSAGEYCDAVTLTSYNAITELEAQASERLLQNMRSQPGGGRMEQVLWSASGSEGIQKAIWTAMSRKSGSNMILATRNGFHGKKGLAGAVTGSEKDKERDSRVRFISFPMEECQSIAKRREKLNLSKYKAELDATYAELGDKICAIITEPYLGGGGSYHPQPEYLQLLEQFCRAHDLVFIFDEVQANFGRTGSMYAFTHYGVEPDIVVLGKGLANGMPVDAAVGRGDLFANLKYGEGSDTWSGHPLGCAAVLATLDEFEQTDVLTHAGKLAKVIEAGLLKLAALPAVAAVRGEGTVWGVEFGPVGKLSPAVVANEVVRLAYLGDAQGRAIHLLGPLAGKVIRVAPPLTMALDEAEEYLQSLHGFIAGVEG
jgi:4-aminobutyrate aminotransferase-like enzyme